MKRSLILSISVLFFLLFSLGSQAQFINWKTGSYKGYVYQISSREARKIIRSPYQYIPEKMLHTQIDSFLVDSGWMNRPDKGHFILVNVEENKLKCEYICIMPFQVMLFREYNALSLQVIDQEGKARADAKVKLGINRLNLDSESHTYRIENDQVLNSDYIASIKMEDFQAYLEIHKNEQPYHPHYPYANNRPDFYSYLITDKNKYKPGEKIRYKSYALSGDKMPLRKELEVWIMKYPKYIKVGTILPVRPGTYAGEFTIHDSLKLTLDSQYNLELKEKSGRIVANCMFNYEDYELIGNILEVTLENPRQYEKETNILTIKAIDANGLLLKDARAKITIRTTDIIETFHPLTILQDTLQFFETKLDPSLPTTFSISPELFGETNMSYTVFVEVLNAENERITGSASATYYYSHYELTADFSGDSIRYNLLFNNSPMQHVPITMKKDEESEGHLVILPFSEKINPAIKKVVFSNDFISRMIDMRTLSPEIRISGGIQQDSFHIQILNPQKIDISWYIYQGDVLLQKGFGTEINYRTLINNRSQTYYVELHYVFGGEDYLKQQQFSFRDDMLNVSLHIPERVYPGQETEASIYVSNQVGDPVKDVDLTAMAVTSKLKYNLPDLPYYGEISMPRNKKADYDKSDLTTLQSTLFLNFQKWNALFHLDTMKYYQFTYPGSSLFRYETIETDSTQFAPFVMQFGESQEILVIEVDHIPVYFSWTQQPKGYSFYIKPTISHEITLRLRNALIILNNISFERGKKTLLSLDVKNLPPEARFIKMDPEFTYVETGRYLHFIASFRRNPTYYASLSSGTHFVPLFSADYKGYQDYLTVGPLHEGYWTYDEPRQTKITYRHQGGFRYTIEDNVVYKENDLNLLPKYLHNPYFNAIEKINDHVITRDSFIQWQQQKPDLRWLTRSIEMIDNRLKLTLILPEDTLQSGILAVLFENCKTGKTTSPCFDSRHQFQATGYTIPTGCLSTILLYNNGSYLRMDSIPFRNYINVVIDLTKSNLHDKDSVSEKWLAEYEYKINPCYGNTQNFQTHTSIRPYRLSPSGNTTGFIFDALTNEPLPGVNIRVRGLSGRASGITVGTNTDVNGHFSLQLDDYTATLQFSFIGYLNQEIVVTRGTDLTLAMQYELQSLEEVVVVGYGTTRRSEVTGAITSISSQALYGQPDEISVDKESGIPEAENKLYQELLSLNSLRSDFSDVGLWEPTLFTDKNGSAIFKVKFPDDITRWNAVVYAMNRRLQTGTCRKSIQSFKPLMAELRVPQFLTQGDSANFVAKVLNYSSDSLITGKVEWSAVHGSIMKNISFTDFHADLLPVIVTGMDTLTSTYRFIREDGYTDGEKRKIPVIEQGILRADGSLSVLQNGDEKTIHAKADQKTIVEIVNSQLEVYKKEIDELVNYRYLCNEQLASRLIGLLSNKRLADYEDLEFRQDRDVKKIIQKILRNQNQEFLWSWWDISPNTSWWMSAHILRALKEAKNAGYEVPLDLENTSRKAAYKFEFLKQFHYEDADLLNALALWNADINYAKYLPVLDSLIRNAENRTENAKFYSCLKEKMLLQEIRQLRNLGYKKEMLTPYKKEGILGEVWFADDKPTLFWYQDDIAINAIAYRIICRDTAMAQLKTPMQLYFMSLRQKDVWNTYQSSNILLSVLPDLLKSGSSKEKPATLISTGIEQKTIDHFPYRIELQQDDSISFKKITGMPVYIMQYTEERVTKAKSGVEGFEIKTWFTHDVNILEAGKPVDIIVDVVVRKDLAVNHVMIEVPIPGSCSYSEKSQGNFNEETHREYYKDHVAIFCEKLAPGRHTFTIKVIPRFTGSYILNPAQVSLMYFPVVNSNTEMKKILVQ